VTSKENRSNPKPGGPAPSLAETSRPALAFHHQPDPISDEVSMPLERTSAGMGTLTPRGQVRRLTPRECERLQGFPDDYTLIDGAADGPRYRALGNSMAVPVMAHIGRRIALVEALLEAT
jgi:DNA (cytosine-5)-methyltransferase 1